MKRNFALWIGFSMFSILVLTAIIGPFIPDVVAGVEEQRIQYYGDGKFGRAPFAPSLEFPLGSDEEGRDILSLIIMGTRDTLFIVFTITLVRYALGLPLAFLALHKHGFFHRVIEVLHGFFSTIPTIFSAVILINLPFLIFSEIRTVWVILLIAFIDMASVAYVFRETAHDISKREYITAGIMIGNTRRQMIKNQYIPVLIPEIIVQFFIDVSRVTLLVGQLGIFHIFVMQTWVQTGFTGGYLENTSYNWATLIAGTRNIVLSYPWIPFFPALAIVFAIFTFQILSDGLRQYFQRKVSE
ncbi:ABC transporter permease subunit [Bacillus sp. HMF5848]|uniref:ABC transporter permease n=1 Tax=Bacillus sp. HMF5848 TaxID=2495421 RepID=UPI000F76A48D|nr:ABC transporter permease subunit [Bacillus sp. HMF5848]RSK26735.1 ABC transporter permease subunit [Bacillus sp. HMF5848]